MYYNVCLILAINGKDIEMVLIFLNVTSYFKCDVINKI